MLDWAQDTVDNEKVNRQKLKKWPYLMVWKGKHGLVLNLFHQVFFLVTTLHLVVTQTPATKQINHGIRYFPIETFKINHINHGVANTQYLVGCSWWKSTSKRSLVILKFYLVYPWFPSEQNAEPISRPSCDSLNASSWFEPMTWSTVNWRARIGESPDRREATTARVSPSK